MNCEIVCVGTELLLGDILNTNAAFLAKNLAQLGVHVYYQSVVGDNPGRLRQALDAAFARADMVITTGGLGPTKDDLTKETACAALGAGLILHAPSLQHITEICEQTGRAVSESQKKQAYLPEGCTALHNYAGTAPGFILEKAGKVLIMLPGPPREMTAMFESGVRPYLTDENADRIYSRHARVMGIGEAEAADLLSDLLDGENPTVAPYAKDTETEIRVTARAHSRTAAFEMIDPVMAQIRTRLGRFVYGVDVDSIERRVFELLSEQRRTLSLAESCTGGLIAKRLTDIPGVSGVFSCGAVTYADWSKVRLLGVPEAVLAAHGAVSEPTARAMARGIRETSGADIGLSVTGIAGPDGGSEEKPVGLVYICVDDGQRTECARFLLGSKTRARDAIRNFAASRALNFLRMFLEDCEGGGE